MEKSNGKRISAEKLGRNYGPNDSLSLIGSFGCWAAGRFPLNAPFTWGIIMGRYNKPPGDSYFIAVDNSNRLFVGRATSGATEVTWVQK